MKYNETFTFENLYKSHLKARLGKRHKEDVINFELDLGNNYNFYNKTNRLIKEINYKSIIKDVLVKTKSFANVEVAILKLNRRYPYWDSYEELNELSAIFKEFVIFEKKIQHKTLCESTS